MEAPITHHIASQDVHHVRLRVSNVDRTVASISDIPGAFLSHVTAPLRPAP
jgi:hypothetical protein